MKKTLQQTLAPVFIGGCIIASSVSVSAMSDTEFQKALIQEISLEENISDVEMQGIIEEVEKVSQDDVLVSLQEEITALTDLSFQQELQERYVALEKIEIGSDFMNELINMYDVLDAHYSETGVNILPDDEVYLGEEEVGVSDFASEKEMMMQYLKEEISIIQDGAFKTNIGEEIEKLALVNEADFNTTLQNIYKSLDAYYQENEFAIEDIFLEDMTNYNFDEIQAEILASLLGEMEYIFDEKLQDKIKNVIEVLKNETNEEAFFVTLDALYNDAELNEYYENAGVGIYTDELSEEDFNAQKSGVIEGLQEEIDLLEKGDITETVEKYIQALEQITDVEVFFEKLEESYSILDAFYESLEK